MALPVKLVAWNYSAQTRIVYASLVQAMREVIYTVAARLIAQGYVCKGSSDGVAGAMDGVNRWTDPTKAGIRANSAVTPISWIVLTDGNGYNICFSYNSASDDVYRIAVDFEGAYVAAATPTHQPTSATEQLLNTFFTTTPGTLINATASNDRIVTVWTRPDAKGFRVAIARATAWTSAWGVDMHSPSAYGSGVAVALAHGFYVNAPGLITATNVTIDPVAGAGAASQIRFVARRTGTASLQCSRSTECQGASVQASSDIGQTYPPELQGATEYVMKQMGIVSTTAAQRGKVGNLIDWWIGRSAISDGDVYGALAFIVIGGFPGLVWPWNGAAVVMG